MLQKKFEVWGVLVSQVTGTLHITIELVTSTRIYKKCFTLDTTEPKVQNILQAQNTSNENPIKPL